MGLLTIIGLCVLLGGLGAWIFQKLHIPQVVGFLVAGNVMEPIKGRSTSAA